MILSSWFLTVGTQVPKPSSMASNRMREQKVVMLSGAFDLNPHTWIWDISIPRDILTTAANAAPTVATKWDET